MKRTVLLLLMVSLCAPGGPGAQAAEAAQAAESRKADDPIAARLFPPELVMAHQQHIGLTDAQRKAITGAITALQSKVVELQWAMTNEQEALANLLDRPSVDEAAALARADHLMELERRVKHEHLATLIRIKNILKPEQQARLRALADGPDSGH